MVHESVSGITSRAGGGEPGVPILAPLSSHSSPHNAKKFSCQSPPQSLSFPGSRKYSVKRRGGPFEWVRRIYRACCKITPEAVDKYSAILFPTAYFIFNIGWVIDGEG